MILRMRRAEPGAGFDCFVAAQQVGPEGFFIGVDMLDEMLEKNSGDGIPISVDGLPISERLDEIGIPSPEFSLQS